MAVDWLKIKNDYINGLGSYRKLAEKYGVSFGTLRSRAEKERWAILKEAQLHKISTKSAQEIADIIVEKEVDRVTRLLTLADRLADCIEQAIQELDQSHVTHKTKIRTLEYKDPRAAGKPTKEIVQEEEKILAVAGIIDRKGLQQVASALKNAWEIGRGNADDPDTPDGDGLLDALAKNAETLFVDGDDSNMLPEEKE